jgi:hypothetical protein
MKGENKMQNWKRALAVILSAAVLAPWVPAQSEDQNVQIMKKLFSKMAQVVGVGGGSSREVLILANPGILIDPELDWTVAEDRARLAKVLDRVLLPSWVYQTNNLNTYDVYKTLLTTKEVPIYELTPKQKELLENAKKVVFSDSNKRVYSVQYEEYRTRRRAFAAATKVVEDYKRANPLESVPADMLVALDEARENYTLLGNKNEMIKQKTIIDTYEQFDPNVWWGSLQQKLDDNSDTINATQVPTYSFYPEYRTWLDETRSWTKLSISEKDLEQTNTSSATSIKAGFGAGWGLWSVGADYNNEQNRTYFKLDVTEYNLDMEMARVILERPWLDSQVFNSRAWKWLATSPYVEKLLSDGGYKTNSENGNVVMPFLPTGLLLARKVKLSGNFSSDLSTTFSSKTSGGGSVGWGPIKFGGRRNSSMSSSYRKANAAGNELSFDDVQILGFFVEVLPKSPDPAPGLNFPSDTLDNNPELLGTATTVSKTKSTLKIPRFDGAALDRRVNSFSDTRISEDSTLLKNSYKLLKMKKK